MKVFTNLDQSRRLAEFLPLESADMYWDYDVIKHEDYPMVMDEQFDDCCIPAWSLAALLDILDYPQLSKDKLGSGKTGWMVSVYPDNCRYDSCWHDNPIDCCVEMICKLYENVEVKIWEWDSEKKMSYPPCQISKNK